jgi:hypothetical protein
MADDDNAAFVHDNRLPEAELLDGCRHRIHGGVI